MHKGFDTFQDVQTHTNLDKDHFHFTVDFRDTHLRLISPLDMFYIQRVVDSLGIMFVLPLDKSCLEELSIESMGEGNYTKIIKSSNKRTADIRAHQW